MNHWSRRSFTNFLLGSASVGMAPAALPWGDSAFAATRTTSIPLTLHNLSSVSQPTPFVSYSHPFADGDIAPGGSVTATDSNGNPVTVQMDAVALWPSGCVRWAVLSHACAETFSGSSAKVYTLAPATAAPNNAPALAWGANPAATLAANSDFKVAYSGFDAGANTYTVSLNTIFSTYAQSPWGVNYPLGGWEYIKKGPVCVEFHGWQYLINDSTAKPQGYVRCDIWVKAWSPTGPFEVDVRTSQPNMWNAVSANSEQRNQKPGRWATLCTVRNRNTVIHNAGGPKDWRAQTIANADFTPSTNRISANPNSFFPQQGVVFASTGALPAGISANTIYWPAYVNGGNRDPYLATQRAYASRIEKNGPQPNWAPNAKYGANGSVVINNGVIYMCVQSGTSAASGGPSGTGPAIVDGSCKWENMTVPFGNQGSGTISAFPVNACFPSTGWHCGDQYGDPIWVGTGTRPAIFPGHDFAYLTTKSKFTPCYNINAGFQTTNMAVPLFAPNRNFGGITWALSTSGDGAGDQRIGYISNFSVASIYNPKDPYYVRATIQGALCFSNFSLSYMNDEASGQPFVGNNGTNGTGVPYANLPPLLPGWAGSNTPGRPATVFGRGDSWLPWSTAVQDQNGYGGQYYSNVDGSHMPALWQVAYLKTGRPCFLEQAIHMANTQCFAAYQTKQTLGATTYYCIVNGAPNACQLRAWAWAWRSLCQAVYMMPAKHIFYPVLRDYYNDNAAYQALRLATFPPQQAKFGIVSCLDHGSATPTKGHLAPWMGYFVYIVVTMEVWRGGLTGPAAGANFGRLLDYMAAQWHLYDSSIDPNAINYISAYDLVYSPVSGGAGGYAQTYTTAISLFNASVQDNAIPGPPFITSMFDANGTGRRLHANFPENCNWYGSIARAALTMHKLVRPNDPTVAAVLASCLAATQAATGISASTAGIQWYGVQGGVISNFQTNAIF